MAYTQSFPQSPAVLTKVFHAYPAFVIGSAKKIWNFFVPKEEEITTVKAQVVEVEEATPLLPPTTNTTEEVLTLDEFIFDYNNYHKDYIIQFFNEKTKHRDLKELWLEFSIEFEVLVDDFEIKLTKSQPRRSKKTNKVTFAVCKGDYFLALTKLNAALNKRLQELKDEES